MNPEAQAELDRILALEPAALSDADRAFLQARRDYLTEEQKSVFAEALSEQPAAENDENAAEQPRTSRGRKPAEATEQPEAQE